jgi:AraC-like DNA-binding protein
MRYSEVASVDLYPGMNLTADLPLMRAVVMEPFIEAARGIGAPVEKILRQVGLPEEIPTDAEIFWPEHLCWHFVQTVTRAEGIPNFGLIAGNTIAHQDLSELTPLIAGCSNLFDLLKRFCFIAPLYSNHNLYVLEEDEQVVRFTQKGFRFVAEDSQVQLFEVLGMIQLVQLSAGPDWRPSDIDFTFEQQFDVENAVELNPSRIRFSRPYPSIAISRNLMSLPAWRVGMFVETDSGDPETLRPIPCTFKEGMCDAILPYLGTENFTKNKVADILGLSPRTLHRRLAGENTSYSEVLSHARLIKASKLLQQGRY